MKIHEYQGKEILRKYGVATPRGFACFSVDEAVDAAKKLGDANLQTPIQRMDAARRTALLQVAREQLQRQALADAGTARQYH